MKVAIIEPVGGHRGMNYYDFGLCAGLSKAGADVTLYTCDETESPKNKQFKVNTYFKRIYGQDPVLFRGLRYLIGIARTFIDCISNDTKICHFHFFHVGILEIFNILCAKLLRRVVVITAHDVDAFAKGLSVKAFVRLAYGWANLVIAHNKTSRDELVRFASVASGKIRVIPHGNYIDSIPAIYDKRTARKHLKLHQHNKIILFFGQIKAVKGLDILIRSIPGVLKSCPELKVLIAGKPWKTEMVDYRKLIDKLNVHDYFIIHEKYIPDEEVPFYFSAFDLIVLPYRKIYQSGVLLKAMSYAKPVLASDLPGMRDVITDGKTGFLFKSEDVNSLADKLSFILKRPEKREVVALNGKKMMIEKYSWKVIGEKTLKCYSEIC